MGSKSGRGSGGHRGRNGSVAPREVATSVTFLCPSAGTSGWALSWELCTKFGLAQTHCLEPLGSFEAILGYSQK